MTELHRAPSALQLDLSMRGAFVAWADFEEARDQAARLRCEGRAYWVYVVELGEHINLDLPDAATVWIGQTHLTPEQRFEEHREGRRANRQVQESGIGLRSDLYADQPELRTRQEADAYQALLAQTLENSGYSVYLED
jgi:hypothetical protein